MIDFGSIWFCFLEIRIADRIDLIFDQVCSCWVSLVLVYFPYITLLTKTYFTSIATAIAIATATATTTPVTPTDGGDGPLVSALA